jgi:hypothetical protein
VGDEHGAVLLNDTPREEVHAERVAGSRPLIAERDRNRLSVLSEGRVGEEQREQT